MLVKYRWCEIALRIGGGRENDMAGEDDIGRVGERGERMDGVEEEER